MATRGRRERVQHMQQKTGIEEGKGEIIYCMSERVSDTISLFPDPL